MPSSSQVGVFPGKGALRESSGHSSRSRRNLTRDGLGQLKRGCGLGPIGAKKDAGKKKGEQMRRGGEDSPR